MKIRWIQLIAGLTMFVLCISVCTATANATVIWSDDFNVGNYDEWRICDNEALELLYPDYGFNGSQWSATNGYLQLDQEGYGRITYPSTVAYGTWSFDFKANETLLRLGFRSEVVFISNSASLTSDDFVSDAIGCALCFDVLSYEEPYNFFLTLGKRYFENKTTLDDYGPVSSAGWHHFDVTRNTTGWISVYYNDSPTPILEGENTDLDTSELFSLWFKDRAMIDNIVVNNEVIPPQPPLPWTLIFIGGGVAVAVIVLAIVFLRRR